MGPRGRTPGFTSFAEAHRFLFAQAMAISKDLAIIVDAEGRFTYANPATEKILGYRSVELTGRFLWNMLSDLDQIGQMMEMTLAYGQWSGEVLCRRRNASEVLLQLRTVLIQSKTGEILGIVGMGWDLTSRKVMEEQLLRTERQRLMGEMASGVAHNFSNAIVGILGNAQLLKEIDGLPEEARSLVGVILNAAGRATEMVSRIQAGTGASGEAPPAFLDLNTVVESCAMASRPKWKNQAESEGRKIELDLDLRAQNRVYGRPSEVDEVLTNLIFNAVDAMPEGGRISIRTWDEDGRIFLSAEDTGVGMPPDVLRRLGELFFTTKGDRGHGLGMAFCYRVVEQMGGRIEVDSTVGEGSRFLIRFPGKDEDQKQNQMDSGRSLRGRQVLVVEDDEYVQNLLRLALPDCDVSVASEGEAGLGLLKEGCFDVALVDFSMPRLNGADVAREIQQIAPNLPIVLMTGWAELPVDVEGLFRGFLTKPFTVQRLKECLSDVLAE